MDYLIRFVQAYESFRQPEIETLSRLADAQTTTLFYAEDSPFCTVRFDGNEKPTDTIAAKFIRRSILSRGIYELWGQGNTYEDLHKDVRQRTHHLWSLYKQVPFKFWVDSYGNKRSTSEQREIIDSFSYLGFEGRISMKNPDAEFTIFEDWEITPPSNQPKKLGVASSTDGEVPVATKLNRVFLGRHVGIASRHLIDKHDLKKRPYISTTSMNAELALVTANFALAAPGKLFLDPFVGTGGFMVAAAELGAVVLGSDIDGRSFRGKSTGLQKGVGANFEKYNLQALFGDCMTSDLTNTPFRSPPSAEHLSDGRWLDGIISDPPYGVREGLKVLGQKQSPSPGVLDDGNPDIGVRGPRLIDGIPAHTLPGYIPPKKPYSFERMMADVLDFSARTLVDGGRVAFWMPTANDIDGEARSIVAPTHRSLELQHECIQTFNKWSRRLLVYERLSDSAVSAKCMTDAMDALATSNGMVGSRADDLNAFRRQYFQGFRDKS